MDSLWFNRQASGRTTKYDQHNNGKDKVDVTLKLGLPSESNDQNQDHMFDFFHNMYPPHGQANLHGPDQSYTRGMNTWYGIGNSEGGEASGNNVGGQTYHNNNNHPLNEQQQPSRMGNYNDQNNMQSNYMRRFDGQLLSSLPRGSIYTNLHQPHTNFMMNPHHRMLLMPPQPPAMKDYTIMDHTPKRVARGANLSSAQQEAHFDPCNQRCTNINCNTDDTPMWRSGPLGRNTLCNACGIKYRREEKRKAKEQLAAASLRQEPDN